MIPFSKPAYLPKSLSNIKKGLSSGNINGNQVFTKKCEKLLEKEFRNSNSKVLLTTSCTHSLEMIAILLDIKKGDEIIVPSYTFVSSALAFHMQGAKIVFCDIRPDTLNIDEQKIENLITKKTKAIVIVHYAGVSCELDKIKKITKKNKIFLIEDNAHGLFAKYKGSPLGSFGDLSALSFHSTKNFSCGEGGALIINNPTFNIRAQKIREKGTNRKDFSDGKVKKYTWVDKGSSYVMSDLLASLLYSQLKSHRLIQQKRKKIWKLYYQGLKEWSKKNNFSLPFVPDECVQSYHMFYLISKNQKERNALINYLKKNKITATSHYLPLHKSPFIKKLYKDIYDCKNSDKLSQKIIRLPLFFDLDFSSVKYIINTIKKFN